MRENVKKRKKSRTKAHTRHYLTTFIDTLTVEWMAGNSWGSSRHPKQMTRSTEHCRIKPEPFYTYYFVVYYLFHYISYSYIPSGCFVYYKTYDVVWCVVVAMRFTENKFISFWMSAIRTSDSRHKAWVYILWMKWFLCVLYIVYLMYTYEMPKTKIISDKKCARCIHSVFLSHSIT